MKYRNSGQRQIWYAREGVLWKEVMPHKIIGVLWSSQQVCEQGMPGWYRMLELPKSVLKIIRFHSGKISSAALLSLVWFGVSIDKLEKGVNTGVIDFTDNTKLFSVEKMRLVQRAAGGHETEWLLKGQMQFRKGKVMHMWRERSNLNFTEKCCLLN